MDAPFEACFSHCLKPKNTSLHVAIEAIFRVRKTFSSMIAPAILF